MLSQFPQTFHPIHDEMFHRIVYGYCRADWDCLRDHIRDVP